MTDHDSSDVPCAAALTPNRLRSTTATPLRTWMEMPPSSEIPGTSHALEHDHLVLRLWAEAELRARQLRSEFLPRRLLGEPGWDILLYLFIQESRRHDMTTAGACEASGATEEAAQRWLSMMEQDGLITTSRADNDELGGKLQLTPKALLAISKWLRYRAALPS